MSGRGSSIDVVQDVGVADAMKLEMHCCWCGVGGRVPAVDAERESAN